MHASRSLELCRDEEDDCACLPLFTAGASRVVSGKPLLDTKLTMLLMIFLVHFQFKCSDLKNLVIKERLRLVVVPK